MNFTLICDLFPHLEYLFGCFLGRYGGIAAVSPNRVFREFAVRRPDVLGKTIAELDSLIYYCTIQEDPEETASTFLQTLDCPYSPADYDISTVAWFRSIRALLFEICSWHWPSEYASIAADSVDSLPRWQEISENWTMPLHLPTVFLHRFGRLNHYELINEKTVTLANRLGLNEVQPELMDAGALTNQRQPLLSVPFEG